MVEKNYQIKLYVKSIKKDKTTYEIYKAIVNDKHIDCCIVKELEPKLKADMYNKGLTMPLIINLQEDDYFLTAKKYKDKLTNKVKYNNKIVITNYQSISQGEFVKRTLNDLIDTED